MRRRQGSEDSKRLIKRILTLAQDPDGLTYKTIAERVGCSDSYVQEVVSGKRSDGTGWIRRNQHVSNKRRADAFMSPVISLLVKTCETLGLAVELIPAGGGFCRREVSVNEHRCVVGRFARSKNGYYILHPLGSAASDECEFVLRVCESADVWIVLPRGEMPSKQTMFVVDPKLPGTDNTRHDWPHYLEAWDLLR